MSETKHETLNEFLIDLMQSLEPMPLKGLKRFSIKSGDDGEVDLEVVHVGMAIRKKDGHKWDL